MRGLLARLANDLRSVIANPQADPRKAVVLLVAGVLVVLMIVVILLYVIGAPPPGAQRERRIGRRVRPAFFVWGLLLVLGASPAHERSVRYRAVHLPSLPRDRPSVVTHKQSNHAEVDCMSCHGGGGVTGAIATRARAAGNLVAHLVHAQPDLSTNVANTDCLSCHEEVTTGVRVVRGIRVRHADFIDGGARCLDCHGAVGHSAKPGFVRRPTMDTCLSCHDGVTAPTECGTCHTTDVAVARRSLRATRKCTWAKCGRAAGAMHSSGAPPVTAWRCPIPRHSTNRNNTRPWAPSTRRTSSATGATSRMNASSATRPSAHTDRIGNRNTAREGVRQAPMHRLPQQEHGEELLRSLPQGTMTGDAAQEVGSASNAARTAR